MRSTIPSPAETFEWGEPLTPTILLVEDEAAVREVTREALEMGGYRVIEASGPEEAMRTVHQTSLHIDLLLTDVVMPGTSGPDLARQISLVRPGLSAVLMSGYADSEVLRAAAHGPLQDHIQKPFTISGLLSRVAQALALRLHPSKDNRPPLPPSQ
jgi:two-component system cell cycle sensor histidine kinase/response regulator CckA